MSGTNAKSKFNIRLWATGITLFSIGAGIAYLVSMNIRGMDKNIQFIAVSITMFLMALGFSQNNKYRADKARTKRDAAIDQLITMTKQGTVTIVMKIARMIADGQTETTIKKQFTGHPVIVKAFNDLYQRGYAMAYPEFITGKKKPTINEKFLPYFLATLLLAGSIFMGYGYTENKLVFMLIAGVSFWFFDDFYLKLCQKKPIKTGEGPLVLTLRSHSSGPYRFKAFLIRYLLNSGLAHFSCPMLDNNKVKISYCKDKHTDTESNLKDKTAQEQPALHIDVSKQGVLVHMYSTDPREPYERKSYRSFNEFYVDFVTSRVCANRMNDVAFYPEVLKVFAQMHDQSASSEERSKAIQQFSPLMSKYTEDHRNYYLDKVSSLRECLIYRLIKQNI